MTYSYFAYATCPRCGYNRCTIGANHSNYGKTQYECHECGYIWHE